MTVERHECGDVIPGQPCPCDCHRPENVRAVVCGDTDAMTETERAALGELLADVHRRLAHDPEFTP